MIDIIEEVGGKSVETNERVRGHPIILLVMNNKLRSDAIYFVPASSIM